MKYVITWHERGPASSEYEALHKRILEIFEGFKMPLGGTICECLLRVGEFGGYMVFETDGPQTDTLGRFLDPIHDRLDDHLRSAFQIKVEPVVDVTASVVASVT